MVWIGRMLTERRPKRTRRGLVLWIMAMIGGGTLALLAFAASAGFLELGIALSARLLFVLILAGAVLPWLDREPR